ncbi:MAG: hypothetical protein QCI38_04445 [Candidatus Thermoplasmatota archaeon]|nr:hypothetical protein [Candidatus Thermoplasmatota archaeon]
MTMTSAQLNVRTSPVILDELDMIVEKGLFRNRTEAVNEALRFLIRRYKMMKIAEQIETTAKNVKIDANLADVLLSSREEEDL